MTIKDFENQNKDKVTVISKLNGLRYLIQAKEGYRILIPSNVKKDEDGNETRLFKRSILISPNFDFETIEIYEKDNNEETIN